MNTTDDTKLAAILRRTRWLFLDFDGPICNIFAGLPASTVADTLRQLIVLTGVQLPAGVQQSNDPLEVLRYTAVLNKPGLTSQVSDALQDLEMIAVRSAVPEPALNNLLHTAGLTGRSLAIVSNNSTRAIQTYLDRHNLADQFAVVVGRSSDTSPGQLKPSSYLVNQAVRVAGAARAVTTLVGDSRTDIEAARSASIASIGYANKPGKEAALTAGNPDAIVTDLATLDQALGATTLDLGL